MRETDHEVHGHNFTRAEMSHHRAMAIAYMIRVASYSPNSYVSSTSVPLYVSHERLPHHTEGDHGPSKTATRAGI